MSADTLTLILFVAGWWLMQTVVLPRFGVAT